MIRQTKVTAMVEAGTMTAIAIIIGFLEAYIPVVGNIARILWAVPIILVGVRHGYKWSMMASCVVGVMLFILLPPLTAITFAVGFSPVGMALGYAIREKFSHSKTISLGVVVGTLSLGAMILLGTWLMGVNIWQANVDVYNEAMDKTMALYQTMGEPEDTLAMQRSLFDQTKTVLQQLMPIALISSAITITVINFLFSRLVLRRLGYQLPHFPSFREWSFPTAVLSAFLFSAGLLILGKTQQVEIVTTIGFNLLCLFGVAIMIQGLAVFYFITDKYNLSRLVRGIILFIIITQPLLYLGVFYAGIFDLATDHRELRTPRAS